MSSQPIRPWEGGQPPPTVTYDFPLRPDLVVRVELPSDLTVVDADRFASPGSTRPADPG